MSLNRTTFFAYVRNAPFGGRLTQQQVDGLTKILDYWEAKHADGDKRWLAYALATTYHETAATMQPIEERGGDKYLRSKKYYPWYGRGLVQITWEANYKKYGIKKPSDALKWPTALFVLFDGMIKGRFTGKNLSQYFNSQVDDPKGARRIVNGTDKAGLIADYHKNFMGAINAALQEKPPEDVKVADSKADDTSFTKDPQVLVTTGVSVLPSILAAINSTAGVAALIVIVTAVGLGVYFYLRSKEKYEKGV